MSQVKLSPMEYAREQNWRKVWIVGNHSDVTQAHSLRKWLVEAEVFPPNDRSADEMADYVYHDAVIRAELPDIVAELDYIDMLAVYRTARLLAIVPRDPKVFEYSARNTALILARHGIGPSEGGYDPKALGIADTVNVLLKSAACQ